MLVLFVEQVFNIAPTLGARLQLEEINRTGSGQQTTGKKTASDDVSPLFFNPQKLTWPHKTKAISRISCEISIFFRRIPEKIAGSRKPSKRFFPNHQTVVLETRITQLSWRPVQHVIHAVVLDMTYHAFFHWSWSQEQSLLGIPEKDLITDIHIHNISYSCTVFWCFFDVLLSAGWSLVFRTTAVFVALPLSFPDPLRLAWPFDRRA